MGTEALNPGTLTPAPQLLRTIPLYLSNWFTSLVQVNNETTEIFTLHSAPKKFVFLTLKKKRGASFFKAEV